MLDSFSKLPLQALHEYTLSSPSHLGCVSLGCYTSNCHFDCFIPYVSTELMTVGHTEYPLFQVYGATNSGPIPVRPTADHYFSPRFSSSPQASKPASPRSRIFETRPPSLKTLAAKPHFDHYNPSVSTDRRQCTQPLDDQPAQLNRVDVHGGQLLSCAV